MTATITDLWPFFGLSISTPQLTLVYPTDEIIAELIDRAGDIHSPEVSPFTGAWSLEDDETRAKSMLQFQWDCRASLCPERFQVLFAIVVDGEVVGSQDIFTRNFSKTRVASTGSWLGREFQGRGIGTEARRAILHFVFEGLGALIAKTGAIESNAASRAVTEKLGYQLDGESIEVRGDGGAERTINYRYERADWQANLRRNDITITGLEPCLPLLGLGKASTKTKHQGGAT